jgi:hypothetical protein
MTHNVRHLRASDLSALLSQRAQSSRVFGDSQDNVRDINPRIDGGPHIM